MIKKMTKITNPVCWILFVFLFCTSAMEAQIVGSNQIVANSYGNYSTPAISGANYYWSVTGGLCIDSACNPNNPNGNTLNTINVKKVGCLTGKLYLVVYGGAAGGGACYEMTISCVPSPPACVLGSGFINDLLCVTNMHPYWRFQIEGFSGQNVTYTWSSQHFTIMSGQGSEYLIGNPTDNGFGFTLYCTVTKTCSGGTKISKTFFYESNSTKSCGQGTTGEVGGGGGETDPNAKVQQAGSSTKNNIDLVTAYPNPFNENITLKYYEANDTDKVSLLVYNSLGQLVLNPVNNKSANVGYNEVVVNGNDLKQGGIYFVSLLVNGESIKTHKIHFNK